MPKKYLYGAAVQGIQQFIFQTNELKDIIGASELVKQICSDQFKDLFRKKEISYQEENSIVKAAGNIKYIFDKEEDCRKIVLSFPEEIMTLAPGITISQAVVAMDEKAQFKDCVDLLEKRLRIQRNKATRNMSLGLIGIQRSHKTGLPATCIKSQEYLDAASQAKHKFINNTYLSEKCFGKQAMLTYQLTNNISDLTGHNSWIAIIHADGNGLGKIVQTIGSNEKQFKSFSEQLDEATTNAAQKAFEEIKPYFDKDKVIPIRPVVLGGDDFTVICRGELAVPYATAFLKAFEEETFRLLSPILRSANISFDRMTACAGIAFIKANYPFYYGYNLAEDLCARAKKDAKTEERLVNGLAQSALMFHKVQDSFVEEYSAIVKRELMPQSNVSWEFGPYYLFDNDNVGRWTIDELLDQLQQLDRDENHSIKSHLRRWMSEMHYSINAANELKNRMIQTFPEKEYEIESKMLKGVDRSSINVYPVYDLLALNTIMNQITK